jgi:hypothetical protein
MQGRMERFSISVHVADFAKQTGQLNSFLTCHRRRSQNRC